MKYDCIIIGGGMGGFSAALVLGRARLNVLLIDNNNPRNKMTKQSHGFITNDNISPVMIRRKAAEDLKRYPSISQLSDTVVDINVKDSSFMVETINNNYETKRIILATGLKETLPNIKGIETVYGNLIFNCPFCDGWELKDKKLAIIVDNEKSILDLTKLIYSWSKHLTVFTHGILLETTTKSILAKNNIHLFEDKIQNINKVDNKAVIKLENNQLIEIEGGFLIPPFELNLPFATKIPLRIADNGRIQSNEIGITNQKNIYVVGDLNAYFKKQLLHAASSGSLTAAGIIREIAAEKFLYD